MEFFYRGASRPRRLGILAGTFNPPTTAHFLLAEAALEHVDEVLWALPRLLPHKSLHGATFQERIAMLCGVASGNARHSVAATDGGLFIDIARECRAIYGEATELLFVCGRDAAQRVMEWDYGRPDALREMLAEFEMLVAGRNGHYETSGPFAARIHPLPVAGSFERVSSTEVRERIARGEPWEHLVPGAIVELVKQIYAFESGAGLWTAGQ
ncbi:MAG: nicotinate-nicotinamide nucleotide adenylyltransferase [Bryobacteraceae bacterium]